MQRDIKRCIPVRVIIFYSSKDTFIKFWDLDTQHCFKTLVGHRSEVCDCVNFQLIFLSYKLGFNRTVSYKLVFRVSKIICLTTLLTTFRIFLQVIYLIKIFFSKKASVQQELFFL